MSIKVIELELSKPIKGLQRLDHWWSHIWALVRLHGEPLGWIKVQNEELPLSAQQLAEKIAQEHTWPIFEQSLRFSLQNDNGITSGVELLKQSFSRAIPQRKDYPLASVIVLLPYKADLKYLPVCLKALQEQDHPNYEILIACNGSIPAGLKETAKHFDTSLVSGSHAFYRAIKEARGEFISLTGVEAVPDKGWLRGVAEAADNPAVAAVTGLMVPLEMETQAQIDFQSQVKRPYWFNRYYNYGQIYELPPENFGTPLNASFRRTFLIEQCNNDFFAFDFGLKQMLFLYYRALKLEYMVGYDPCALIWERYPLEQAEAQKQVQHESLERAEFLAMEMRWNPSYRKILWQKLKESSATKRAILHLTLKSIKSGLKGIYASHS